MSSEVIKTSVYDDEKELPILPPVPPPDLCVNNCQYPPYRSRCFFDLEERAEHIGSCVRKMMKGKIDLGEPITDIICPSTSNVLGIDKI